MPTLVELLIPEFAAEMASTRRVLAAVPEGRFDWKPHEKSMSMGRLAGHVASIPSWLTDTLREGRVEVAPDQARENVCFRPASSQEMLERFDTWVAEAQAELAASDDPALEQEFVMTFKGQPMLRLPRRSAIRTWVLNHLIHHRGQLGVYLRLNDVKVPGVYGPSADAPVA
jgi:uncharacterized damage-inducible protein DinB